MVSEDDKLFISFEKIFDVFLNGLLLSGSRGVKPLEENSSLFRLRKTCGQHLLGLTLHLSAIPEKKLS
jgi:hypothetical protein